MPSPGPDTLGPLPSLPSLLAAHASPLSWESSLSLPNPWSSSSSSFVSRPQTSSMAPLVCRSPELPHLMASPPARKECPTGRAVLQDLCPGKESAPWVIHSMESLRMAPPSRETADLIRVGAPLASSCSPPGRTTPEPLARTASEPWRVPSHSGMSGEGPPVWQPPEPKSGLSTFHRLQQELLTCQEALISPSPFLFSQGCAQFSRLLRRTLQHANEGLFFEILEVLFDRLETGNSQPLDWGPVRAVFDAALSGRCVSCWSPRHRQVITQRQRQCHMLPPAPSSWTPPALPEGARAHSLAPLPPREKEDGDRAPPPSVSGPLPSLRSVLQGPPHRPWSARPAPHEAGRDWSGTPMTPSSTRLGVAPGIRPTSGWAMSSPSPSPSPPEAGASRVEAPRSVRMPSERSYPFFRLEGEFLIPPRALGHADKAFTIQWPFTLSPELARALQERTCAVHLLVISRKNGKAGPSPPGLTYRVNGQALATPGHGPATRYGFDMSGLCTEGANELSVTAHQCCCNLEFAVHPVRCQRGALVQRVQARTLPPAESLRHIMASFSAHGDLAPLKATVSLCCPLSQCAVKIPVRGRACTHLQCFDLESYLEWNQTTPAWRCPLCQGRARWDDLVVDPFMCHIIQQVGDTVQQVYVDAQGQWSPVPSSPSRGSPAEESDEDSDGENSSRGPSPVAPGLSWTGKRREASPPSPHAKKLARLNSTRPWVDLT